ncbi:hypothetical protein A2U01_0073606, partial [Trifolium medium]|nr:hypothetical protein [Trifolium medium]
MVSGAIRCRLFPTTLRKGAMTWYQSLAPQSVSSWKDIYRLSLTSEDSGNLGGYLPRKGRISLKLHRE